MDTVSITKSDVKINWISAFDGMVSATTFIFTRKKLDELSRAWQNFWQTLHIFLKKTGLFFFLLMLPQRQMVGTQRFWNAPLVNHTWDVFFFKSISRWSCRCSIFPLNFGIFHHLYRLVFLKLVLGCLVGPASNSNQFSQRVFVRRKAPTIFFQFHTSFQGGGKMVRLLVKERILWKGSISHFHGWGRSTSF